MNRFLAVVCVLIAIGVGVGFYLKWFNVEVDQSKMANDLNKGKEIVVNEAKDLKEKAENLAGSTTMEGKVVAVDMEKRKLTFKGDKSDKEPVVVTVDDKTKILGEDKKPALLADLKSGQTVSVRYGTKDQEHLAYNITEVHTK
jgi:hypothetical protein